jgi:hypothetical protein
MRNSFLDEDILFQEHVVYARSSLLSLCVCVWGGGCACLRVGGGRVRRSDYSEPGDKQTLNKN